MTTPQRTIRAAILGCGRIGERHATVLTDLPEFDLVGVADVVDGRAHGYAERFKTRAYRDLETLIASERPEVIEVCTPSGMHAGHVIAAARAGVPNIVVEKPMALTLADADAMIAACAEHGSRLFVVQQNRYNPPIRKLREALDAGRLGRLVMATARVWWCRHQAYYDQDAWRGTWAQDGGVFANQASHYVDMLTYTMGPVASIAAITATRLVHIEAEDTGVAVMRFANGATGVIEATTAARPTNLEGSISILGENGVVEVAGFAMNEMRRWTFANPEPEDEGVVERFRTNPPDVYGFGHHAYLRDVAHTIATDGRPAVDGADGRASLEVIVGLYESAASGQVVTFPVTPRHAPLGRPSDFRRRAAS